MGKKQYLLTVVLAVVAGFVGGVGSSWFLMGAPVFAQKTPESAKVIQAEKFEVVDKDGKVRAWLGIEDDREPRLMLYAEDSKNRSTLAPFGLVISDQNDAIRAALVCKGDGEPSLSLSDKNPKSRAMLTRSGLVISDQNDAIRAALVCKGDGDPFLSLFDKDEKARADFSLSNGEPSLDLFDKSGKTRATLGYTELKIKRTGSTEQRSPASLVLVGEDGKVIWSAP